MKNWLSSPLAINYLLSLRKNGASYQEKYLQIYRELKNRGGFLFSNRLFYSSPSDVHKYDLSELETVNLDVKESSNHVINWISQYGNFKQETIQKYGLWDTKCLLCNALQFKGTWNSNQPSPIMRVHNSFNYTEDIRYEARLLELPMRDDALKLVIIVPNEPGSVSELFRKLCSDGLDAATSCVHPLFTFSTVLDVPGIEFSSSCPILLSKENCDIYHGLQLGIIDVNQKGANMSVVTCLTSTQSSPLIVEDKLSEQESPFYFALLYNDIAIFTGRYLGPLKREKEK